MSRPCFITMTIEEAEGLNLVWLDETDGPFDFDCVERMIDLKRTGVRVVACVPSTLDRTVFYRYAESVSAVKGGDDG